MTPQEAQSKFTEAKALLDESKFDEAKALLLEIRNSGSSSVGLEANLGRVYSETGSLGLGVHHFQNAVLLDRFDFDLRQDLELAKSLVPSNLGKNMGHPADWGQNIAYYIRPNEAYSVVIFLVLSTAFLRFFFKKLPRKFLFFGISLIVLFLVAGGLGSYGNDIKIVKKESSLRNDPIQSALEKRNLPAGSRVYEIRTSGDFTEIERANQFRGWVPTKDLIATKY